MRTIKFDGEEYYVHESAVRMIKAALAECDKGIRAMYDHNLEQCPGTSIMTVNEDGKETFYKSKKE